MNMMKTVSIFGLDFINDLNHAGLLKAIAAFDSTKTEAMPLLITPNVDQVVKFHRKENAALFKRLRRSAFVLPDGQPIVWTSKLKKGSNKLQSRLTGSDLFPALWKDIKARQETVFMILPNKVLGEKFSAEYKHMSFYVPPMFQAEDMNSFEAITGHCLKELTSRSYDHVMIGLGFPKQELLSLEIIDRLPDGRKPLFSLLGASFEFYFGMKSRAPQWMQNSGLEFMHRLLSEPGRMIKRYLWDDLAFFPLMINEIFRKP